MGGHGGNRRHVRRQHRRQADGVRPPLQRQRAVPVAAGAKAARSRPRWAVWPSGLAAALNVQPGPCCAGHTHGCWKTSCWSPGCSQAAPAAHCRVSRSTMPLQLPAGPAWQAWPLAPPRHRPPRLTKMPPSLSSIQCLGAFCRQTRRVAARRVHAVGHRVQHGQSCSRPPPPPPPPHAPPPPHSRGASGASWGRAPYCLRQPGSGRGVRGSVAPGKRRPCGAGDCRARGAAILTAPRGRVCW